MSCLLCNHVFNELPDTSSNLANLYSDSTAWVLLHSNTRELNNFKGQSSSNWKLLFYEASCNKLQVTLLFEYFNFAPLSFLVFQFLPEKLWMMILCSHFCCLSPIAVYVDSQAENWSRIYYRLQVIYLLYDEWHWCLSFDILFVILFCPWWSSCLADAMVNVSQRTLFVCGNVLQDWPKGILSHSVESCQDN